MEPEFKTSFIPKKTLAGTRKVRGTVVGLFFVLTLVIFLGSLLLSIGVFAYKTYLERSNIGKLERLEQARAEVEPSLIRELERLDTRMKSAETLLRNHRALSAFFEYLERTTLASVQFEDFSYAQLSPSEIGVTMSGKARSFGAIALQSDTFADSAVIEAPLFSDLDLDESGNVTFQFTGTIAQSLLQYSPGSASSDNADPSAPLPEEASAEEDLDNLDAEFESFESELDEFNSQLP